MAGNVFNSAVSALNAAQYNIATTEHNIANANTRGYTRQEVLMTARPGQQTGSGFIGQGVDATGIRRVYDQFLVAQVRNEQTQASYLTAYHDAMSQIDNLIADPTAGASPALQSFFTAVNSVANNPESIPSRQTMLTGAQFAVNRFKAIDARLSDIGNSLNGQIGESVKAINNYAQQIAALNANIKTALGSGQGIQPNDLMDQREQILSQLNKEVKATALIQSDGAMNVFIGNGQSLVVDQQAMTLKAVQSAQDPSRSDVVYINNGIPVPILQSSLQGGKLGAYLDFRDKSLEPSRNALGRVAMGLAMSMNAQNRLGQDLNGQLGLDLFSQPSPRIDANANNIGTAVVGATIDNLSGLTTSDYSLRFNAGAYTLVRMSDSQVTNLPATFPGTPVVVDGFKISIFAGAMASGDSFQIRPTANAARDIMVTVNDPAKFAAAAPMRGNTTLTNLGTGKIASGTVNPPPSITTIPATDPNLQATVTITFDPPLVPGTPSTTFTVTGAVPAVVGSVPYTAGANISYNGWTTQITGTPLAGDTFTMQTNTSPNSIGVGDNRNGLLLAGLQTQNLMANGSTNLQGAYGQLVGDVGSKTNELAVTSLAQDNMLGQSIMMQQSTSGVNLDEEAANMLRFQKAYQAAAKVMQTAGTMFDTLLSVIR